MNMDNSRKIIPVSSRLNIKYPINLIEHNLRKLLDPIEFDLWRFKIGRMKSEVRPTPITMFEYLANH